MGLEMVVIRTVSVHPLGFDLILQATNQLRGQVEEVPKRNRNLRYRLYGVVVSWFIHPYHPWDWYIYLHLPDFTIKDNQM